MLSLSSALFFGCSDQDKPENKAYSFFVAGHTYGKAGINNVGFHPPFKNKLDRIRDHHLMSFGVLTGDIVYEPTAQDWQEVDDDIAKLGIEVHIAPGNHEYRDPAMMAQRFEKTYYRFIQKNDLHIILDPNFDHWNISGDQLDFLKNTIKESFEKVDNIFVYFHQVLWWDSNNEFAHLRLNSKENRDPKLNFWKEVLPLFEHTNRPVFMFAGDVGGAGWSDACLFDQHKNIQLIASGMGKGQGDNFLIVEVDESKKVQINLIALNGDDENALGKLEDFCHIKKPTPKEEISITLAMDKIQYNGFPFKMSRKAMEGMKGEPDSIVEPKYECGPFSEDWQEVKFYQYFYGTMNFIVYEEKAEVQDLIFSSNEKIEIGGSVLDASMDIETVAKQLNIKLTEKHNRNIIEIIPEEGWDEYYYLKFKNGALHKFDRFEPC